MYLMCNFSVAHLNMSLFALQDQAGGLLHLYLHCHGNGLWGGCCLCQHPFTAVEHLLWPPVPHCHRHAFRKLLWGWGERLRWGGHGVDLQSGGGLPFRQLLLSSLDAKRKVATSEMLPDFPEVTKESDAECLWWWLCKRELMCWNATGVPSLHFVI